MMKPRVERRLNQSPDKWEKVEMRVKAVTKGPLRKRGLGTAGGVNDRVTERGKKSATGCCRFLRLGDVRENNSLMAHSRGRDLTVRRAEAV